MKFKAQLTPSLSLQLHEFEVTNPDSVPEGELFEKDILLTPRQWQEMKLRKAITDPRYRWPNTVLYRYADGKCIDKEEAWKQTETENMAFLVRFR